VVLDKCIAGSARIVPHVLNSFSHRTILFSHPADKTPVCTTELGAVARLKGEWAARNTNVIALSCDSVESHLNWVCDIQETQGAAVEYPIIADESRAIATAFNMLDQTFSDKVTGLPLTVRSVFIIDPNRVIKLILTYPAAVGRNFTEVLRCLDALQMNFVHKLNTPVDWVKGVDVIVPPAMPLEEAQAKYADLRVVKPYLRYTADPTKGQ
jgi:alkyl hydroperoxide reductase subunit AhpC